MGVIMLIDLGAQVSSISSGFCKQMALNDHPLDRLLKLEGTGRATIPYLEHVEVNVQIQGARGYNEDVMLLVTLTTTYVKKVPVMARSTIINRAMGIIMKGELAKATVTWRETHFSVVMSGSLLLTLKCTRGYGGLRKENPLQQPLTQLHLGDSTWTTSRGMSIPHRGSQFLCFRP